MASPQRDVVPYDSENNVRSGAACSTVDNGMSCSSRDITSPIRVVPLEATLDSRRPMTSGFPSESSQNSNDHDHHCKNCTPCESDEGSAKAYSVTPHLEVSSGENVSSVLCRDIASPVTGSPTTTECIENDNPSVDSEVHSCAPIVAVGGAKEKELKRGLKQRLGLVLSKLARDTDEDEENVDDQQQRESLQVISYHSEDEDVVSQPGPGEAASSTCTTADGDECSEVQHVVVMDIVQEMDEVEHYSYVSLVAYAMHELFEYSTWNQYVVLCLITV